MIDRDQLTPREVAERTGFSYHAILRAIKRGDLAACEPIPGRLRIEIAEYERWRCGAVDEPDPMDKAVRQHIRIKNEQPDAQVVYLIQRGTDGPIKIGRVRHIGNFVRRLAEIQSGCAEELQVLALLELGLEHELHLRFASHRLLGEWFEPHPRITEFAENTP